MNKPITKKTWITLGVSAIIAIAVYMVMNVVSSLDYSYVEKKPLSKEQAIEIATQFVNEQTGFIVSKAEAYHDSSKDYTGYLAKYKLTEQHMKSMEAYVPNDQYRVNVRTVGDVLVKGSVFMNIESGEVIGWDFTYNAESIVGEPAVEAISSKLASINYPVTEATAFNTYDEIINIDMAGLSQKTINGYVVAHDEMSIKDAVLQYKTNVVEYNGEIVLSRFIPEVELPADYLEIIKKEDFNAAVWTYGVYLIITIALGILAIIYAILYRRHTSFKYGVWLTIIASIIYLIVSYATFKSQFGLMGDMLSDSMFILIFTIIITFFTILFSAASYYFSFVAGDGLWRAQGFNLWPKFSEAGYGQHVWNCMKVGYLMAIIALGIQSVIFFILTKTLGTWVANDTSQSLLNFEFSWLYPLIAWFAAISEEVVFRFFGVGIFRRWFKNTWVAALIPTVAWAAAHTLYPLYPTTTRVIELIIIGYIFTWVMMRFGFIAAVFMHAVFNSILIGLSMLDAGSTTDAVSAVFFIVLPVIIAFVIKKLHERKKDTREPTSPPYPPLTPQE